MSYRCGEVCTSRHRQRVAGFRAHKHTLAINEDGSSGGNIGGVRDGDCGLCGIDIAGERRQSQTIGHHHLLATNEDRNYRRNKEGVSNVD